MNTIADMIERCRPTSGERAHYFADDWSRYERNALVALQQMGIETIDSVLTFGANAQPKDRYKAWLYDSLVWTIGRIRQGYPHEALRGLLQMCEILAGPYDERRLQRAPEPFRGGAAGKAMKPDPPRCPAMSKAPRNALGDLASHYGFDHGAPGFPRRWARAVNWSFPARAHLGGKTNPLK